MSITKLKMSHCTMEHNGTVCYLYITKKTHIHWYCKTFCKGDVYLTLMERVSSVTVL